MEGKYLDNLKVYWPTGGLLIWNYFVYLYNTIYKPVLILFSNNSHVYHTQVLDSTIISLHQCSETLKKQMTPNT